MTSLVDRRGLIVGVLATTLAPCTPRAEVEPGLTLTEVASGVLVSQGQHGLFTLQNRGQISNLTAIIGREAIAVVDTGGSVAVGRALLAAIGAISNCPIRYVINTHMHPDHVFGNAAFASDGTLFVGNAKLPRALAARGDRYIAANRTDLGPQAFDGTRIIAPTVLVDDRITLDLGDRKLTLTARKTAHTDNDLTVFDEQTRSIILGDLLFSGHVPVVDGSIVGWIKLMAELQTLPADRAIPGHGPASMAWPQALEDQSRYLEAVASDVRAVLKRNGTLEDAIKTAGQSERDNWVLFDQFHARNVTAAFAELEWE